jgi:hypothetical protein
VEKKMPERRCGTFDGQTGHDLIQVMSRMVGLRKITKEKLETGMPVPSVQTLSLNCKSRALLQHQPAQSSTTATSTYSIKHYCHINLLNQALQPHQPAQ